MSKIVSSVDFEGAAPELLALVVLESDKRIASHVQLMLAQDARANGLLAAATALAAAGIAVAADKFGEASSASLFAAASAFAATSVASAWCSLWALWPEGVDIPGWSPWLFKSDVASGKTLSKIQAEIICKNQEKLNDNDQCNAKLARRAKIAMALLAGSPIAGATGAAVGAAHYAVAGGLVGIMAAFGTVVGYSLSKKGL